MRSNKTKSTSTSATQILPSGGTAAVQSDLANLKRLVLTTLLFENSAYQSGNSIINDICRLIPKVDSFDLVQLAIESRIDQGLRHVPLFVAKEMLKHAKHRASVPGLLKSIMKRADEPAEFLAMFWQEQKVRPKMPNAVRRALASVIESFDAYQLTKYLGRGNTVTLADVIRLTHPKAPTPELNELYRKIVMNEAEAADTWNKRLSLSKTPEERKASWLELMQSNKLPALATLRNINNFQKDSIEDSRVAEYIKNMPTRFLNPLNFYAAYKNAASSKVRDAIDLKFAMTLSNRPKLPGRTVIAIDTSGSMRSKISDKSEFTRKEVAYTLAIATALMSEECHIFITADRHQIVGGKVNGFAYINTLESVAQRCGGGGIYTRQVMEHMKKEIGEATRVLVISDSQDCEYGGNKTPNTSWALNSYIIDVSSHTLGVNYSGVWTSEISGWSDKFLDYVLAFEGLQISDEETDS